MTAEPFVATIRSETGATFIDLAGKIDAFAEHGLNAAFEEAEAFPALTIVLNFENVGYINSTGIALIVGLLARARKQHRQLVVIGLSEHYTEIFRITRLSDFMSIYPDEASAKESFVKQS
jgi:anti-sigma B factor antagonist